MHREFDLEFATSRVPLTEEDIEFGRRHGLVSTGKAQRLAHLFPIDELPTSWSNAHTKWRLVALIWAIENLGNETPSLFDEIDAIWTHFNEPEDMKHLVSFMPTDDPFASPESLKRKILEFVTRQRS